MSLRAVILLSTAVLSGGFVGSGVAQLLAPELDILPPRPLDQVALNTSEAAGTLVGGLFMPYEDPPEPPPVPGAGDAECAVPWRLVGTVIDVRERSRSFAAIHTPDGSRLLATSMTHRTLTLVELEAEGIVLQREDGRRCAIRMFGGGATTIAPLAETAAPPAGPVRRIAANHVEIDPALLSTPAALAVRGRPFMRNGQLAGVRLSRIRPGSPAAIAGAENGDLITHIDGVPIEGADIALAALARMRSGEAVRVTLEREGEGREVTISTPQ